MSDSQLKNKYQVQADTLDAATIARARSEVERALPEIQSWRDDHVEWINQAEQLIGRLLEIERPLLNALSNCMACAAERYFVHKDWHDEEIDMMTMVGLIMDQELVLLKAVDDDLFPFPPLEPDDIFAQAMEKLFRDFVGKDEIYNPRLRASQFTRHGI